MTHLIPTHDKPLRSIIILGPPGSGKGTIGKTLALAGNHYHLSSGDIFRGLSPVSPAGQLFSTYASKGHLLPDDVTIAIWRNYVAGLISTNRYFPDEQLLLLDGVPRTLQQAKIIDSYIEVNHIVVLEMADIEGLVQRMKKRALIEGRSDDTHENVLRTRMEVYEKQTKEILSHYSSDLVTKFNADQSRLEVLRDILMKLCTLDA